MTTSNNTHAIQNRLSVSFIYAINELHNTIWYLFYY